MIDKLLSKLNKVRQTKPGEWVACCPVHNDKHPSMGIKLTPDGKIICHCFSCHASGPQVAEAVGMDISDLFPPREGSYEKRQNRTYLSADTVLGVITYEANIISLAACDIINKIPLSKEDTERVLLANNRLRLALEYIN